jgi:peptidyl-prolyl cis-trans isomerase B (cyclophilin B)
MPSVMNVLMSLFSVLMPAKMWYAPGTPIQVTVKSEGAVNLVMLEATGKPLEKRAAAENVEAGKQVDVRAIFPEVNTPGAYYLFAVPAGKTVNEFVGTPLVFTSRADKRAGGNELQTTKVEPLRYAVIHTEHGDITCGFYYDVAPNTITAILDLASQGYYDGLTFHRIVPDFVIQGGDPMGNGRGGPGFQIDAEFNDRPHDEGVLSMARTGDPLEGQGLPPRCEAANSAGSQFFVVLSRKEHLDGKYTAFGKAVSGLEAVRMIAKTKLVDPRAGKPETAPVIKGFTVHVVTPKENPYRTLMAQWPK